MNLKTVSLGFIYFKNLIFCKPTSINFLPTDACCLRCKHCDIWKNKKIKKNSSFDDSKKIIDALSAWLGSFKLNFSGGEVLLDKKLFRLIDYANKKNITCSVNTNGVLINDKKAEEIVKSKLDILVISLDGIKSKTHDYLRGVDGTYKKVINAIKLINKHKARYKQKKPLIFITTVIYKKNIDEIIDLIKWVKKNNLGGVGFQPLFSNYFFGGEKYENNWYKKSKLWPQDYKKIGTIINKIISLKNNGYLVKNSKAELLAFLEYFKNPNFEYTENKCSVGTKNFSIETNGDVRLCYMFPPIGNILKDNPKAIWKSKKALIQRKGILLCKRNCKILLCNRNHNFTELLKRFMQMLS